MRCDAGAAVCDFLWLACIYNMIYYIKYCVTNIISTHRSHMIARMIIRQTYYDQAYEYMNHECDYMYIIIYTYCVTYDKHEYDDCSYDYQTYIWSHIWIHACDCCMYESYDLHILCHTYDNHVGTYDLSYMIIRHHGIWSRMNFPPPLRYDS